MAEELPYLGEKLLSMGGRCRGGAHGGLLLVRRRGRWRRNGAVGLMSVVPDGTAVLGLRGR